MSNVTKMNEILGIPLTFKHTKLLHNNPLNDESSFTSIPSDLGGR